MFEARSRTSWEIIRRVSVYLKPYGWRVAGTLAFAVLSLAFSFAFPKLTQWVIDEVIGKRRAELLAPAMIALLAAFALRDLFNSLRIRVNNTLEQNVIFDLRRELYGRLQLLPAAYFDARASGDLMTRVSEDVNNLERLLIDGVEQGTVAVLSVGGGAGDPVQHPARAGPGGPHPPAPPWPAARSGTPSPPTAVTAPSAKPPAP